MYTRIQKRTARKLFEQGKLITLIPCKFYPGGMFFSGFPISQTTGTTDIQPTSFDDYVSEMEYYNCNYETGYYAAFYIQS